MKTSCLCTAIALATALSATTVATAAPGKDHCDTVTGSASGFLTSPNTASTNVSLEIAGNPAAATSVATLLSSTVAGDGATLMTSSHAFTVGADTFTTYDRAILTPTNNPTVMRLNSHVDVTGGTGDFTGAYGTLVAHGFLDFADGSVRWEIRGKLCSET